MRQAEHHMGRLADASANLPAALIVAGPTCSGKSALALALARRLNGEIINADSMQVYKDLHILTARPSAEDEQLAPHRLYGVLPAEEKGSVAWWREQALACMQQAWAQNRLPILCGGTGMYLHALTNGLAIIPDTGEEARQEARQSVVQYGAPALHARLMEVDPETASRLRPVDSQRVSRAWEVWRGTGHGLTWWHKQPGLPPAACRFVAVRLNPERAELRARIAARFENMLRNGALAEVQALLARKLDTSLPAMRAHGVPELSAMLHGEITEQEATQRAVQATGRYTKRQATWFAHHSLAKKGLECTVDASFSDFAQFSERKYEEIVSFVLSGIDAA